MKGLVFRLAKRILLLICIFVPVALFYRCPSVLLFDMECPACGMTRAFVSALRLDFAAAFAYHPLFPLLLVETAYFCFRDFIIPVLPIPPKWETAAGVATLVLLLVVWLIRM